MRQYTPDGKYWTAVTDGTTAVGLSPDYYDRLGTAWVFAPQALGVKLKAGQAFAHMETSKGLVPLLTPVDGTVVKFNPVVLDTPDQLSPADYLVEIK